METIVGIDLGTTNSEIALLRDGRPVVLEENGEAILPSVVGLDNEGRLLVGTPARNQWVLAPERTVRSIKRKMGQELTVRLGDRDYTPQEISAFILQELKKRAERALGRPVHKAVITVPAFFNEVQREATREAGELAGLEVVRIINEPTAAALTYDPLPDRMERLVVYDLGGGTFDLSIVQIEQGVVEVLASHGDTQLGGDDFDQLLLDHVCDRFAEEHQIDLRQSPVAKSRLLRGVEEAKKTLSYEPVARIQEEFIGEKGGVPLNFDLEVERWEYEGLIASLLEKTLLCVDQSLTDARLHAEQIDRVILVGGASRTPMVHRLLQQRLGREIHTEIDPDLCVAMGAAVQGGLISGIDVGPVLVDITPHTLGIQALGELHGLPSCNVFAPIIERNTALPASRSEMFSTAVDGQEGAIISVFQGEADDVRQNQPVGEFVLEGLADVAQGNEILVRFDLDLDGILQVKAVERATGLQKRLTIDNALCRFRRRNVENAPLSLLAESSAPGPGEPLEPAAGDVSDTHSPPPLSPELQQAVEKCQALIAKAQRLASAAGAENQQEIRQLVEALQGHLSNRAFDQLEQHCHELEDLVFYLQDT